MIFFGNYGLRSTTSVCFLQVMSILSIRMYSLETIQDIRKNSNLCVYCLESTILDTIQFLESTLIVPNVSENFQQQRPYYSKSHDNHDTLDEKEEKYSTTSSHFSSQRRNYSLRPVTSISPLGTKYGMNAHQNSSTNSEDWTTLRSFKSTVFTSTNLASILAENMFELDVANRRKEILELFSLSNEYKKTNIFCFFGVYMAIN